MLTHEGFILRERDVDDVSGFWKGCHLSLIFVGTVVSIAASVFFHILFATFDNNCFLYPKYITLINASEPGLPEHINLTMYKLTDLPIDFIKSQWANDARCYSSLYNPVLSVIFGCIWMTFFFMCPKGGRSTSGLSEPWKIVLPSIPFTFIYSIVCITVSSNLHDGLVEFDQILNNVTGIHNSKYQHSLKIIDTYVMFNELTSWLYTSCWILSFLFLILRCVFMPDFQLVRIKVDMVKEHLKITEQHDSGSRSTLTTPLFSHSDKPSTSTGIFDKRDSFIVHADVEPEVGGKKVGFTTFDMDDKK